MKNDVTAIREQKIADLWSDYEKLTPAEFLNRMTAIVSELPVDSAIGLFELASANDSTGNEAKAAPLYKKALGNGLTGLRRRRANIQLASTIRNLGDPLQSVEILRKELHFPSDELDDAVKAFLSLALIDVGREREAAAIALTVVAPHLVRYQKSLRNYANKILNEVNY
jgi:hypothetical protein